MHVEDCFATSWSRNDSANFYHIMGLMLEFGQMDKTLTVIIPFLNEEKTIADVLKKVLAQKMVLEVILVDDGSTDASVKMVKPYLNGSVKLVRHKANKGKGHAIITGLKRARGRFVLIQDADLEYQPKDYAKLIKPLQKDQAHFVLGNRWQSRRGYLLAQAGNIFLVQLINLLFRQGYGDTYTGYKAGLTRIWRALKLNSSGFEVEAEITAKLALLKAKVVEVPISYSPRKYSEGKKIHIKDVFKGGKTLIKLRLRGF